MNRIKFITLVAGSLLAMAFTISCSNENEPLTDSRDGKVYRTVKIGKQTWMAENLNYSDADSIGRCYDDEPSNCEKYGKLYDWDAAMKACPGGWHLPSYDEWNALYEHIGGNNSFRTVEKKLKSKSGWKEDKNDDYSGSGTDDYGFSALPGGLYWCNPRFDSTGNKLIGCIEENNFSFLGSLGFWWTATEDDISSSIKARFWHISEGILDEMYKPSFLSIRCVKNRF